MAIEVEDRAQRSAITSIKDIIAVIFIFMHVIFICKLQLNFNFVVDRMQRFYIIARILACDCDSNIVTR